MIDNQSFARIAFIESDNIEQLILFCLFLIEKVLFLYPYLIRTYETKRNLACRPQAYDAVVKTIRYIIDVIVDQYLDNSRWISTYPPVGSPFILRGPRNMRTICAAHSCRKRAEDPSFDRCTRKKSIPQRKDDWPWASVTKSRVYVSLRRSGISYIVNALQGCCWIPNSWGTETLVENADFLDRRETSVKFLYVISFVCIMNLDILSLHFM